LWEAFVAFHKQHHFVAVNDVLYGLLHAHALFLR
jgi:hypothetical protein